MADSSRHNFSVIEEMTYGTTPATPAFSDIRQTGVTLALSKTGIQSEELYEDRQERVFRHGVKQVGGDVSTEMSYGSHDQLLESLLQSSFSAGVLKVGTTRKSFSGIRDFTDITTGRYWLYTGLEVNSMTLNATPDAIVTASYTFLGQDQNTADTPPTGATFGPATTTDVFDSFSGTIEEGGVAIGIVTALDLTIENGLEVRNVIGSDLTLEPSVGRCMVTGNITVFFEDTTLYNKFVNETESSLKFSFGDAAGNNQEFFLPKIKINGGQPDVSGQGSITLQMPIKAIYDATEATTIRITNTDA